MLNFLRNWPRSRIALAVTALSVCGMAGAQAVGAIQLDRQPTLQASQAATNVPPVAYQSVFGDLPKGVETTALDWKAANANVGQFKRGYADLLKWEQEQTDMARKTPAGAPAVAPNAPPNTPPNAQPVPATPPSPPSPSRAGGQP